MGSPIGEIEPSFSKVMPPKHGAVGLNAAVGGPLSVKVYCVVAVHPRAVETVSVTVYVPGGNVIVPGFCDVEVAGVPPGKLQFQFVIGLFGSGDVLLSLNDIVPQEPVAVNPAVIAIGCGTIIIEKLHPACCEIVTKNVSPGCARGLMH